MKPAARNLQLLCERYNRRKGAGIQVILSQRYSGHVHGDAFPWTRESWQWNGRNDPLFVFVVLAHERRRVVHFNVTNSPTAQWTSKQEGQP